MRNERDDLKKSVEKFCELLQKYPDEPNSTLTFVSFLRSFLRIRSRETLPTVEVMTLIREFKPNVFHMMKNLSKQDNMLAILTELSMELREAEERIQSLKSS